MLWNCSETAPAMYSYRISFKNCSESAPKLQSYLTSNKQQTSIWNCSQNAPKLLPNRSQTALKPAQTELIINELTVNLNEMNSTMKRL